MKSKITPKQFGKICRFVAEEMTVEPDLPSDDLNTRAVSQFPEVDAIDLAGIVLGVAGEWRELQVDVPPEFW